MAMGQKESASQLSSYSRKSLFCSQWWYSQLSLYSLRSWWVIKRILHQDQSTQTAEQKTWGKELAEVSWGLQYWGGGWSVPEKPYVPSPFCPSPAEDAAALNLKGLVINSFSLQLLNEPLRRNESSLLDPWPPQTDCVRLGVWLPKAMVHVVLSQRAVALGDRDTKQSSSTHYS